jgi:hypothetical protein
MPTPARPPSRPDFLFGLLAGMSVILVIVLGGMVAWMFLGRSSGSGDRPAPQSRAAAPRVSPSTQSGPPAIVIEPLKPDGGGNVGVSQDGQGSQSTDGGSAGNQPSPDTVAWGGGVQIKSPGQIDGLPDAGSGSGQGGTTNQDPVNTPEAKPDPSPPQDPVVDQPKDRDGDGVPDDLDNCPNSRNEDQKDSDDDKSGDVCDEDRDGDGFPNTKDNCPDDHQPDQFDQDRDGRGDFCDETPVPPDNESGDGRPNPRKPSQPPPPPPSPSDAIDFQDASIAVEKMDELEKKLKGFPSDPEKRAQSADEIGPVASESVHVLAAAIRMMSRELEASNAARQRLVDARKSGMPGLTPEETLRRFRALEADAEAKTKRMRDVCSRILGSAKSLANAGLAAIRPEELGDAIESSGLNEATRELHEKWSALSERTPKPPGIPSQGEVGAKLKSLAAWLGKLENDLK